MHHNREEKLLQFTFHTECGHINVNPSHVISNLHNLEFFTKVTAPFKIECESFSVSIALKKLTLSK